MEGTRLPKYVMFGDRTGGGRGLRGGGRKKSRWGCFLDDLRAFFCINADLWTTAAQDEEEWHKTAEQGVERFMAKCLAVEKARTGLWHAVIVCPNVTGRTKERVTQSKRARAGSLSMVD